MIFLFHLFVNVFIYECVFPHKKTKQKQTKKQKQQKTQTNNKIKQQHNIET